MLSPKIIISIVMNASLQWKVHISVLHTVCFGEDCSYLQPQMFFKEDSGFLEIFHSVFVCFILRLDYWKKRETEPVQLSITAFNKLFDLYLIFFYFI